MLLSMWRMFSFLLEFTPVTDLPIVEQSKECIIFTRLKDL